MTHQRVRGEWFWVGYGPDAIRVARECIARSRREGDYQKAAYWERREQLFKADPTTPLRIKLPPDYVERHMNKHKYFHAEPWFKGL